MRRVFSAALLIILTIPAAALFAQNTATNTAPAVTATNTDAASVGKRYENANERWRISTILMILKDDASQYTRILKEMRDFTSTSRSYVIFKRKGHELARDIYYRNLENISRIEQIKQILDNYKKEFKNFNKDFLGTYKLENRSFASYENFDKIYQIILDRWRREFETAMKAKNSADLQRIRQDMQLLRLAITAFILFPGKSSAKVTQLQKMENDVRHAVVMVKLYEIESKK